MTGRTWEAGISLVEALVAVAIGAVAAQASLDLLAGSSRRLMQADAEARVAQLAASLIETGDADRWKAGPGRRGTTPDGLRWQLELDDLRRPTSASPYRLLGIRVTITDTSGRRQHIFHSARLVPTSE